jgi:hypothetical protein
LIPAAALGCALATVVPIAAQGGAAQQPAAAGRAGSEGARGGRGGAPQSPRSAKESAPVDFTGYWSAVITQDWRWRMVVPPKGEYAGIPLNAEGRRVADTWDADKDEAAGEQCRAFGALNVMRLPTRVHITWLDDDTLKIETDAGMQTRLLHFKPVANGGGDWQGLSNASWEAIPARAGRPGQAGSPHIGRAMKVITTNVRAGYLRRNGVPYSGRAVMAEYLDRLDPPKGDPLLVITTTIEDPTYLAQPYLVATTFAKQRDAAGWSPTPCSVR